MALWHLATGNSYRTTSKVFGIGLSTVAKIMYEFCEAILEISHKFIHFPTNGRETAIAIQKFHTFTESKIPQVVGVNDGTHIEIYVWIRKVELITFQENSGMQSIPRQ